MNKLKILFLTSGLGVGGAERMLQKLVMANQKSRVRQIDYIVVSLKDPEPIGSQLQSDGIAVEYLGLNVGIKEFFAGLSKLRKIYSNDISLVQSWMYHADFIASLFKILFPSIPLVWGLRNSTLKVKGSSLSSILVRGLLIPLSYICPKMIISCSKNAIDQHSSIGFKKGLFQYVPNGISVDEYSNQHYENATKKQHFKARLEAEVLVGMVGRFHPQKNFEGFFEVAGMIASENPLVGFILQGTGIAQNEVLLQLARNHGIEAKCALLDVDNDVRGIYQCLDVHLLTSLFGEGFPNVIIESLACGVRNFVFAVGDNDSIAPGNMVTVCDSNVDMANEVIQFLGEGDSDEGCKKRMNQFTIENYNINKVFESYLGLYKSILDVK